MNKRILIAPDKFKGSLTAREVCSIALEVGVSLGISPADIDVVPLADGGDGSLDIIRQHKGGQIVEFVCHDALFRKSDSPVLFVDGTVYIESASVCGLHMIHPPLRDPIRATSFGIGELIMASLKQWPVERLVILIGGTATSDGGFGFLQGLGYTFYASNNKVLPVMPDSLDQVFRHTSPAHIRDLPPITMVYDVSNFLLGDEGAAYTYAPQKGADAKAVQRIQNNLTAWHSYVMRKDLNPIPDAVGYGAGGGIPFAAASFLRAELASGTSYFFNLLDLEERIKASNLVITGEGRLDQTSFQGKIVGEVIHRALKHNRSIYVICGQKGPYKAFDHKGLLEVHELIKFARTSDSAIESAQIYLKQALLNVLDIQNGTHN